MNNTPNNLRPLNEYTIPELREEFKKAVDDNNDDRAEEILAEIQKKKKEQVDQQEEIVDFNKKRDELLERYKKNKKNVRMDELAKFIEDDQKNYQAKISGRIDNEVLLQKKHIDLLKDELSETKEDLGKARNALAKGPDAHEFFSFRRRRLGNFANKIKRIKEADPKKQGNAKKVLIHCMATSKYLFLGSSRAFINRGRVKMLRRRKDTEINKELASMHKRLEIRKGKDGPYTIALKEMISKEVKEAQAKYAQEVSKKITG